MCVHGLARRQVHYADTAAGASCDLRLSSALWFHLQQTIGSPYLNADFSDISTTSLRT